jgi:hypothetical protein
VYLISDYKGKMISHWCTSIWMNTSHAWRCIEVTLLHWDMGTRTIYKRNLSISVPHLWLQRQTSNICICTADALATGRPRVVEISLEGDWGLQFILGWKRVLERDQLLCVSRDRQCDLMGEGDAKREWWHYRAAPGHASTSASAMPCRMEQWLCCWP